MLPFCSQPAAAPEQPEPAPAEGDTPAADLPEGPGPIHPTSVPCIPPEQPAAPCQPYPAGSPEPALASMQLSNENPTQASLGPRALPASSCPQPPAAMQADTGPWEPSAAGCFKADTGPTEPPAASPTQALMGPFEPSAASPAQPDAGPSQPTAASATQRVQGLTEPAVTGPSQVASPRPLSKQAACPVPAASRSPAAALHADHRQHEEPEMGPKCALPGSMGCLPAPHLPSPAAPCPGPWQSEADLQMPSPGPCVDRQGPVTGQRADVAVPERQEQRTQAAGHTAAPRMGPGHQASGSGKVRDPLCLALRKHQGHTQASSRCEGLDTAEAGRMPRGLEARQARDGHHEC